MKILHLGDLHIGKKVNGYSMIEDQKYVFEQLYTLVQEKKIETVIIAGDIYDRSIPSEEAIQLLDSFLDKLINELHLNVIAVSGNHDSSARINFSNKILSKQGLHILGEYHEIVNKISIDEVDFYLMPFVTPSYMRNRFEEIIIKDEVTISTYDDTMRYITGKISEVIDSSKINIGIYHGFVIGSNEIEKDVEKEGSVKFISVGGKESVSSSYFKIFNYTALGHLHGNRRAGAENIWYSGSPLKYSFSEEKQKKYFQIIDIDKTTFSLEQVDIIPKYEMYSLKGSLEEVLKSEVPTDSYLKITLTEIVLDAMSKLKSKYSQIMELTFDIPKVESIRSNLDIREINHIPKKDLFKHFALEYGIELSKSEFEKVISIMDKIEGVN